MASGVEVGTGYITIVPSAQGFLGKLQADVAPAATTVGQDAGKRMGGGISSGFGAVATSAGRLLAPIAAALAAVEVGKFFGDAVDEAREAEKVGKTTTAIIKATGGAAKITADGVGELAAAISNKSGMDDEAIQSGANLLLTFKNVRNEVGAGNDVFSRATQAAVDLSAAGFGSVEGSSKMLGKALNDPLKGISALGRAGVTFSEDQKKAIEKMVKTGDVLGAQKLIMQEVESQVGGVAAANATASEKMQVAWGNFKEYIGTSLLPVLDGVQNFITEKVLPGATMVFDAITGIGDLLINGNYDGKLADLFGWEEDHPLVGFLFDLREGVMQLFSPVDQMKGPMKGFAQGGEEIKLALQDMWAVIQPILLQVWQVIQDKWVELEPTVRAIFDNMKMAVGDAMTVIQEIIKRVTGVIQFIWDTWGQNIMTQLRIVMDVVGGLFKGASDVVSGIWKTLAGLLTGDTQKARDGIERIFGGLQGILGSIFDGIVRTIANVWDGIKSAFAGPVNWVINNVINPLIRTIRDMGKTFGISLNLPAMSTMPTGGSSSPRGSSGPRALRGGGILDGYTPFAVGDDQWVKMRSGEGVYVSEAMLDPYERRRLYEVNRLALAGRSLKEYQASESSFAHLAGGGIVPNATQGFRGYNPAFLNSIKAWAAATGRMWHMTGIGGARDYATQKAAYLRHLAGTGPLAANPDRGGPHMIPANAMDLSPRPGEIPSARGLLGTFGLGLPVGGEPWHVGWAGGGRRGGSSPFNILDFLTQQVSGIIKPFSGGGAIGDLMNGIPKWILKGAAGKMKDLFGFDQGGWMMPDSFGYNGLQEPEAVLTPRQISLLEGNLNRAGVVNNVTVESVTIPVDDLMEIRDVREFFEALGLGSLMPEEEVNA